jgi:hypothetical protein
MKKYIGAALIEHFFLVLHHVVIKFDFVYIFIFKVIVLDKVGLALVVVCEVLFIC